MMLNVNVRKGGLVKCEHLRTGGMGDEKGSFFAGVLYGRPLSCSTGNKRVGCWPVFELPGGLGGLNPATSPCRPPYLWSKFDPGGVEFQPPHLSFSEVGMLLDSHFLLMQFSKYLGLHHDDLNVATS